MNPKERELFRVCLLQALAAQASFALTPAVLKVSASIGGFVIEEREISQELQYLADKGLVVSESKLISPENKRWRITAQGRDALAEQGLG